MNTIEMLKKIERVTDEQIKNLYDLNDGDEFELTLQPLAPVPKKKPLKPGSKSLSVFD
jgi:hypothetical protein